MWPTPAYREMTAICPPRPAVHGAARVWGAAVRAVLPVTGARQGRGSVHASGRRWAPCSSDCAREGCAMSTDMTRAGRRRKYSALPRLRRQSQVQRRGHRADRARSPIPSNTHPAGIFHRARCSNMPYCWTDSTSEAHASSMAAGRVAVSGPPPTGARPPRHSGTSVYAACSAAR